MEPWEMQTVMPLANVQELGSPWMPCTYQLKLHHPEKINMPIFLFYFQFIIAIMSSMLDISWELIASGC